MNTPYEPARFDFPAFNCPNCGAYAKQTWYLAIKSSHNPKRTVSVNVGQMDYVSNFKMAECSRCYDHTFWLKEKMIYPNSGIAPLANPDMPKDVRQDYDEAR